MRARAVGLLAALLALPLATATGQKLGWVPDPRRANGGWVSDPAHHLKGATVDSINAMLTRLESETSNEIAVVVLDSLSGLEPADAALLLHRKWGVGKQARDNGLVLLWSPTLRKLFVSVGQGLEGVIPDARAGRIQDEEILPAFRANDFDRGILQGTTALAAAAREETDWRDTRLGFTPARTGVASNDDRRTGNQGTITMGVIVALLALFGASFGVARWRRNRPRQCPNGHGPMRRLSEQDDDAALEEGERVEESVKSIDYDVWVCPVCDARTKVPYQSVGSSYSVCSQCQRRTVETRTRTLRAATQLSEGLKRVIKRCQNCDWSSITEQTTPRLPLFSSSSGSSSSGSSSGGSRGGGSSFGGGSSGGGGAGRSY